MQSKSQFPVQMHKRTSTINIQDEVFLWNHPRTHFAYCFSFNLPHYTSEFSRTPRTLLEICTSVPKTTETEDGDVESWSRLYINYFSVRLINYVRVTMQQNIHGNFLVSERSKPMRESDIMQRSAVLWNKRVQQQIQCAHQHIQHRYTQSRIRIQCSWLVWFYRWEEGNAAGCHKREQPAHLAHWPRRPRSVTGVPR